MKWKNIHFGEFEYNEEHILMFPEGILGFEDLKKFILINDEQTDPILWLVSLEDESISFPVIDPWKIIPQYSVGDYDAGDYTILAIVTLKGTLEQSTINLRSPLIISNSTQEGHQVVLDDEKYSFHYPMFEQTTEELKG